MKAGGTKGCYDTHVHTHDQVDSVCSCKQHTRDKPPLQHTKQTIDHSTTQGDTQDQEHLGMMYVD